MCDLGEKEGEDDDLMENVNFEQPLPTDEVWEQSDSEFFNDLNLFFEGLSDSSPVDDGIDNRADEVVIPNPGDPAGDGGPNSSSQVDNYNLNNAAADDSISEKRKRQERNRDAAVRSRERKKLYVRELEMKSRYFEGECKRLGMLLNCVTAENHALRLSFQAFDASRTKQESAVLFLESLLLGSLLWFLGAMCPFNLPEPLRSTRQFPLENADNQNRGSLAPRKTGSKILELQVFQSLMKGKRCKASRTRMKLSFSFAQQVLV